MTWYKYNAEVRGWIYTRNSDAGRKRRRRHFSKWEGLDGLEPGRQLTCTCILELGAPAPAIA